MSGATKRLSGRPRPASGSGNGRLELGDEVVAEVGYPTTGLAAPLGLLEREHPRAAADQRVAAEPALFDRLEQKARRRPLSGASRR